MRYVFEFVCGPLDGNALHYKDGDSELGDGAKAYRETRGGEIGRRFAVINPDTPANAKGEIDHLQEFIYQATSVEVIRDKDVTIIRSEYVEPGELHDPSFHVENN